MTLEHLDNCNCFINVCIGNRLILTNALRFLKFTVEIMKDKASYILKL